MLGEKEDEQSEIQESISSFFGVAILKSPWTTK
jgi:hypothetical protein